MTAPHSACQTIDGFVDTLGRLFSAAWGPDWGVFTEEHTAFTDPQNIPLPQIVFHLLERAPMKELTPLKKRYFTIEPDPEYPGYNVEIYKAWYECRVGFQCFARTNREARHLALQLEDFLTTYAGYFKEQGISEINFLGEEAPQYLNETAGVVPYRTLYYKLRIEHTIVVRTKVLEDVVIRVQTD